jgi:hypothetical protein
LAKRDQLKTAVPFAEAVETAAKAPAVNAYPLLAIGLCFLSFGDVLTTWELQRLTLMTPLIFARL